jgi:hypothetical protein
LGPYRRPEVRGELRLEAEPVRAFRPPAEPRLELDFFRADEPDFFAEDFLAEDFLAEDFLAADFFAPVRLLDDFFAAVRLLAARPLVPRPDDFLLADFFELAFLTAIRIFSLEEIAHTTIVCTRYFSEGVDIRSGCASDANDLWSTLHVGVIRRCNAIESFRRCERGRRDQCKPRHVNTVSGTPALTCCARSFRSCFH